MSLFTYLSYVAPDISDEIKIPPEILEEAGIDESRGLEIYTDNGCVIISEAEREDE